MKSMKRSVFTILTLLLCAVYFFFYFIKRFRLFDTLDVSRVASRKQHYQCKI